MTAIHYAKPEKFFPVVHRLSVGVVSTEDSGENGSGA